MPSTRPGRGWDIDDVLARTDLARLLDELAEPATDRTRGRRWHCPVPEHDDHHASVTMHTDHRGHERWRCWSGDDTHRGDAIDLVTAAQHLNRAQAIDWLAERAGLRTDRPAPPLARTPGPRRPAVVALDPAVPRYAHTCERILWTPTGAPIYRWLRDRGFTDETLRENHVGADPGRRVLARKRGLPYGAAPAAVFPALGTDGIIRYLQARYLQPGDGPKYDNPATALGSNPRLAWTRTPTGQAHPGLLLVCEGIPDALTAAQAGYNTVAILGSHTPDHAVAAHLATRAEQDNQNLVAVIDADPAGRAWGTRLAELLADHDTSLSVIEPPDGFDLNTWSLHDPTWPQMLAEHGTSSRPTTPMLKPVEQPSSPSLGLAAP